MDKHEATKAIKEGVARWGCKLIDYVFEGNDVTITVKGEVTMLQVGKEYSWSKLTPQQLALRVSRFCTTYANNKPYRFSWDNKSLV